MPTESEIDVLTTERDNALLRAEELEHQLRRKLDDCGCDGQAYEDIRAERDAARDAVAAMTVEIADLRRELETIREVARGNKEHVALLVVEWDRLQEERDGAVAAIARVREYAEGWSGDGEAGFVPPEILALLDPVVTADAGEGSAVTTAGEVR